MKKQMPRLSKSRFMAGLQCYKRLYLELFQSELADPIGEAQQAIFDSGTEVGALARQICPGGVLIAQDHMHHKEAIAYTAELLADRSVSSLYEAAFLYDDVRVRADILVRVDNGMFDLIEVKSGNSLKSEHIPDVTIQVYVLEGCGLRMGRACLAHLNKEYVYPGGEYDIGQLFVTEDVTEKVRQLLPDVPSMLAGMRAPLVGPEPPQVDTGRHCSNPYTCEFYSHCHADEPKHHVRQLPNAREELLTALATADIDDIHDIPSDFAGLSELQQRVRDCVVGDCVYMSPHLHDELDKIQYPSYFLDFETFNPALPLYIGTHPYHILPFQWSCHIMDKSGNISHEEFLHDSSGDPREPFAESLIKVLGDKGSIVVYSSFEATRIKELLEALPHLSDSLSAILDERMVDLWKIIKDNCYHPEFHGSFSIKAVLPALVPELDYSDLEIQEGRHASAAFVEMIHPDTERKQKEFLRKSLLAYCERDTEAEVRLLETLLK